MHKETKRAYGFTFLGAGVSFLLATLAHSYLLPVFAGSSLVAAAVFLVSYQRDLNKERAIKKQLDYFIACGGWLLSNAPENSADQAEIEEWKKYHDDWITKTWVYLEGAAARAGDKFAYLPLIDPKPHAGIHEDVHSGIDAVYKRMDMLREILEKPDTYLSD